MTTILLQVVGYGHSAKNAVSTDPETPGWLEVRLEEAWKIESPRGTGTTLLAAAPGAE
jgi:hypothetical protein